MDKIKGKIIKGLCGSYEVATLDSIYTCPARGGFRHSGITPLIGDDVLLDFEGESAVISEILPRRNSFIRPPISNIDYMLIVIAAKKPSPALKTIDMMISIAENSGVEPIVIVNKEDLDAPEAKKIADIYQLSGFKVFITDCKNGSGIEELKKFVKAELMEKCAAFSGASGVGKSTLLNVLFPSLNLMTGDVSRKTERGRHTTRAVELYSTDIEGERVYIADTPGFSLIDFERFDFYRIDDLPYAFREVKERLGECKYTKCSHTKEEGCRIVEAVNGGEISKSRHESYCELHTILKNKKDWDK